MKPVVYHCEADVELVGAAKRYECQCDGLGKGSSMLSIQRWRRFKMIQNVFLFTTSQRDHVVSRVFRIVWFTKFCRTPFTSSQSHTPAANRDTGKPD